MTYSIVTAIIAAVLLQSCCQIGNYVATNLNPVGNLYTPAPCWPHNEKKERR
jgi:hypothetical protein